MATTEQRIKELQEQLHQEQKKTLRLRMRMAVLIEHPKGIAAEKISRVLRADADFSESLLYLN